MNAEMLKAHIKYHENTMEEIKNSNLSIQTMHVLLIIFDTEKKKLTDELNTKEDN